MLQTEDLRRQRFGKRIVRGIRQSKRNAAALIIVQTIFVQPHTDERADMNVGPLFDCVKRHVKMIAKTKWSMERSMVEIT